MKPREGEHLGLQTQKRRGGGGQRGTLWSKRRSRSCRRGETCGRDGKVRGSFCTIWNSLKTFGALKGMRPNAKVYRHAPRAYMSVGRPLHGAETHDRVQNLPGRFSLRSADPDVARSGLFIHRWKIVLRRTSQIHQ